VQFTDLKSQYAALKPQIDARIQRVLDHGQYIMGPEVAEMEAALAAFVGVPHCISVASGTEALLIALMALGVGSGDEVLTPAFTFAATAEVVALLGAKPVFVDIEPDTCHMSVADARTKLTPRTRALMPVSLYGQVPDMAELNALAAEHGLPVIEDGAQSFGALYEGRRSCGLSTFGATSFFPSKPLGCYGDGGALFTADVALAQAAREIRVHGQSARYQHSRVGVGGRMDTLQCAVVLAKFERFVWELAQREHISARYLSALAGLPGLAPVAVRPGRNSVWAQMTLRVLGGPQERDALAQALKAHGIPTAVHYPVPLNRQPAYAALCCPECCPHSAQAAGEVLSLPMSADLSEEEQAQVLHALRQAAADLGMTEAPAR
jgi:UDP-2-acetamido-2-deoxy-ribo-hexuluronate aminotransferase